MLPSDQGIIHAAGWWLFYSPRPTKLVIIHAVSRQSSHPCCHPTKLGIIHSNVCLRFIHLAGRSLVLSIPTPNDAHVHAAIQRMHYLCRRLPSPSFMLTDEARYHPHCLSTKLIYMQPSDKAQYHPCCRLPAVPYIRPDEARDFSCRRPRMLTTMLTSNQGSSNASKMFGSPPPPIPI